MSDKIIEKAQLLEMNDFSDLLRLIVSRMGKTATGYLYHVVKDDEHIYFLSQTVPGWYDFKGIPLTMYAKAKEPTGIFIKYNMATEADEESWSFTDFTGTSPKSIYIPIIKVSQLPDFLL